MDILNRIPLIYGLLLHLIQSASGQGGGVAIGGFGGGGGDFMLGSPFGGGGLPSPFLSVVPTTAGASQSPTTAPPPTVGVTMSSLNTAPTPTLSTIGDGFNPSDLFSMFGGTGEGVAITNVGTQNTYDIQTRPPTGPTAPSLLTTKKASLQINNIDDQGFTLQNEAYTPMGSVGNLVKVPNNPAKQDNKASLQIPETKTQDNAFADIIIKPVTNNENTVNSVNNDVNNIQTSKQNINTPSSDNINQGTEMFNPGTGMADEIAALQSSLLGAPVDMSSFIPPPSDTVGGMSDGAMINPPVPAEFSTIPDAGVSINNPTASNPDIATNMGLNPNFNTAMNANSGTNPNSQLNSPPKYDIGGISNQGESSALNQVGMAGSKPAGPAGMNQGSLSGMFQSGPPGLNQGGSAGLNQGISSGMNQGTVQGFDQGGSMNQGGAAGFSQGGSIGMKQGRSPEMNQGGVPGFDQGGSMNQGGAAGFDQGRSAGIDQGGVKGFDQGSAIDQVGVPGFDQGGSMNQGGTAGFDQGRSSGMNEGRAAGFDQGGSAGMNQGGMTRLDQSGASGINQGGPTGMNFLSKSNLNTNPQMPQQAGSDVQQPPKSRLRDMFSTPQSAPSGPRLASLPVDQQPPQDTGKGDAHLQDMTAEGIFPFEGSSAARDASIDTSGAAIQDMNKAIADHNTAETLHLENQATGMGNVPPLTGTNGGRITNLFAAQAPPPPPPAVDQGPSKASIQIPDQNNQLTNNDPNSPNTAPGAFMVGAGMPNAKLIQTGPASDNMRPNFNPGGDMGVVGPEMGRDPTVGIIQPVLDAAPGNVQPDPNQIQPQTQRSLSRAFNRRDQPVVQNDVNNKNMLSSDPNQLPSMGGQQDRRLNAVREMIKNVQDPTKTGFDPTIQSMDAIADNLLSLNSGQINDMLNSVSQNSGNTFGLDGVPNNQQPLATGIPDTAAPNVASLSLDSGSAMIDSSAANLASLPVDSPADIFDTPAPNVASLPLDSSPDMFDTSAPGVASLPIGAGTARRMADSPQQPIQNIPNVGPINIGRDVPPTIQAPSMPVRQSVPQVKPTQGRPGAVSDIPASGSNQQIVAVKPEWISNVFGKIGNALQSSNQGEPQLRASGQASRDIANTFNDIRKSRVDFNSQPSQPRQPINLLRRFNNNLPNQNMPGQDPNTLQIVPLQNRRLSEPQNQVFTLGQHRVLDTLPTGQPATQDIMTDYQTQNVIGTSETKPLVGDGTPQINNIQIAGLSPNSVENQLKSMMMLQDAQLANTVRQDAPPPVFTAFEAPGMSLGRSVAVQESFGRQPNIVTIQAESNVPVTDNRPSQRQEIAGSISNISPISNEPSLVQVGQPSFGTNNPNTMIGQNTGLASGQMLGNTLMGQNTRATPGQMMNNNFGNGQAQLGNGMNTLDTFANGLKLGQPVTDRKPRPSPEPSTTGLMLPMTVDATRFTSGSREAVFGSGADIGAQGVNTGPGNNMIAGLGNNPSLMCNHIADPNDQLYFMVKQRGGYQRQRCALGTAFDPATCECSVRLQEPADCLEVHMDFNNGIVEDSSYNKLPVGNQNVEVTNKSTPLSGIALFNSNSKLTIWRYQNYDFRDHVMLKVQFRPGQTGDRFQPLISNCDGGIEGPSIGIIYDNLMKEVRLVLKTSNDTRKHEIPFSINPEKWNDVTYIYDGEQFIGIVNGVRRYVSRKDPHLLGIIGGDIKSVPVRGLIEIRDAGIILGHCPRYGYYNGAMVDIQIYTCIPKNFRLE